jgi:LmbE family N-acetylglucosaminyl deacetylase
VILARKTNILVISAHPDDESLGCSGTIAKHVDNGDNVHLLFMADGVSSRDLKVNDKDIRLASAHKVADILGVNSITSFGFPDNKMDVVPLLDIIKKIEKKIDEIHPEVIYTHHIGDLNIDHQITHKAVVTACRPQPNFCVKEIYVFEVLSSTEWQTPGVIPFSPDVFVDISDFINIKKQALESYNEEMCQSPHSRSIENALRLNALRGNAIGVNYAEAFKLIRKIC